MSESEFNLLKHLQRKQTDARPIDEQRAVVRELVSANKDLVQQIWIIDHEFAKIKPGEDAAAFIQRKKQLEQQLKTENYSEKIEAATKKLHDMEVEIYGNSDVGKSSPYRL